MRPTTCRRAYVAQLLAIGLVVGAVAATGCAPVAQVRQTLDLRDTQQRFAQAVIVDNGASVDPFVAGQSEALFAAVIDDLDDQRIAGLEPRLQANAWMMRSVAAWRSGRAAEALASAERGLAASALQAQSRDQVLLTLIPALVIDSDLRQRLSRDDKRVSADSYAGPDGYRANFETAVGAVDRARALVGPATPESTVHYVSYHAWRVLTNWRYVISRIEAADARQAARQAAADFLDGAGLEASATAAATAIPSDAALRRLIREQGGPD